MFALYENLAVPVAAIVLLFFYIELFSWSRRLRRGQADSKEGKRMIFWDHKKGEKIILGEKVGRSHAKAPNPLSNGS